MPTARLTINPLGSSLTLVVDGVDLKEPVPEHPVLANNYDCFSYYDHVGIRSLHHWRGVTATIQTMRYTGRGQTELFDRLVGARIARRRLELSREAQRVLKRGDFYEGRDVGVHLGVDDIRRIQELVQMCADDVAPTFFVWNHSNLGRYDVNNRLVWGRG